MTLAREVLNLLEAGSKFKVGDKVGGNLFDKGKIIALGTAKALLKYDNSGAVGSSISDGEMKASDPCAAVKLDDEEIAVYPQGEIFKIK